MLFIENCAFPHIDGVARVAALGEFRVIANLAFETYVGDESLIGLWIETRQIAGVGIAVRIAICDIEQKNEIIAVGKHGHVNSLLDRGCGFAGFCVLSPVHLVEITKSERALASQ